MIDRVHRHSADSSAKFLWVDCPLCGHTSSMGSNTQLQPAQAIHPAPGS